ncbi:DUF6894 family protein [Methylorubrum thiocyanatum]|uniref:DUF6894 family protein n=1 Tax=Methylorubrum thiocyanatum TaxID=47958 RepID=UPI0036575837
MSRYFFDVHDGVSVVDDRGSDLPDDAAARAHAQQEAASYVSRPGMLTADGGAIIVDVRDELGPVLSVRLVFNVSSSRKALG